MFLQNWQAYLYVSTGMSHATIAFEVKQWDIVNEQLVIRTAKVVLCPTPVLVLLLLLLLLAVKDAVHDHCL